LAGDVYRELRRLDFGDTIESPLDAPALDLVTLLG
jgi:hypothetical protein